jgi:hypothetical protein
MSVSGFLRQSVPAAREFFGRKATLVCRFLYSSACFCDGLRAADHSGRRDLHSQPSGRHVPHAGAAAVRVSCSYVGANADTVEKAVTIPLEESINGVEGMRYISSSSTNTGSSTITATFKTGYNLDIAAVDVQNRVASVQGRLPAAVNSTGITISKSSATLSSARAFSRGTVATPTSSSPTTSMSM